jgi:hypothetical protein
MPGASDGSSALRVPRSEIDRRAVGAVGHLLMVGMWLERQFKCVPNLYGGLVDRSGWPVPIVRACRGSVLQVNQTRDEEL